MFPVELSPASQTVSSSSTLWAQPSKEWIIPAKPKPGRKPKETNTETLQVLKDDVDQDLPSSKRVQNRAAQRAFRERKQTQLAELQARLHMYEQGEIERNVALQSIAKKMKEENEELRRENQTLREKIVQLERERGELLSKDNKRAYDDTSTSSPSFPPVDISARKRARVAEDEQEVYSPVFLPAFLSSPSSPDDTSLVGALSPGHENHSRQANFPIPPPVSDVLSFTAANETFDEHDRIHPYNCVLCTPDAPCVCKGMTVQQSTNDSNNSCQPLPLHSENVNHESVVSLPQPRHLGTSPAPGMSILDNPPAFQAPVPIRRRRGTSRANPVFPVTPIATVSSSSASKCSGDPNNCMACADDNFGKAFCQAIGDTMNTTQPCIDCPKRTNQTDEILVGGCCGDVSKCGSCGIAPIISSPTSRRGPETMPTDDAWRQLKSHPNVAFADLTLLAEVVARRSKCTGSRVVLSPAPESITPDQNAQLSNHRPSPAGEDQDQPVLLTDPREHFRQDQKQQESPPQLIPQHVLIECGRRRVREVNADGVREALRLLDQKFAHMR